MGLGAGELLPGIGSQRGFALRIREGGAAMGHTILIVDDDPDVRDVLREGVFAGDDFRVLEARDGPDALTLLGQESPDLILLDLVLPGLSGMDVLVAFGSHGVQAPVIVMTEDRDLGPAVEAFRLGAADVVAKPLREAEVAAAADRVLERVRMRQERDALVAELRTANEQLSAQVTALTTLHDIGESVVALRDLESVFNRVLEAALAFTGADHAMLLLRDDRSDSLILRAGQNLPLAMLDRLGAAVRDELADLVLQSREPLVASGDGLRRFKAGRDRYAVAYVPLIVQTAAIGVLAVGNHQSARAFDQEHARLLKILASYAAMAIVSVRLSVMLDQRSRQLGQLQQELRAWQVQRREWFREGFAALYTPLEAAQSALIWLQQHAADLPAEVLSLHLTDVTVRVEAALSHLRSLEQPSAQAE